MYMENILLMTVKTFLLFSEITEILLMEENLQKQGPSRWLDPQLLKKKHKL